MEMSDIGMLKTILIVVFIAVQSTFAGEYIWWFFRGKNRGFPSPNPIKILYETALMSSITAWVTLVVHQSDRFIR